MINNPERFRVRKQALRDGKRRTGWVALRHGVAHRSATRDLLEIGLSARDLPRHARLKVLASGGVCLVTARIGRAGEVDAWPKSASGKAFDALG